MNSDKKAKYNNTPRGEFNRLNRWGVNPFWSHITQDPMVGYVVQIYGAPETGWEKVYVGNELWLGLALEAGLAWGARVV